MNKSKDLYKKKKRNNINHARNYSSGNAHNFRSGNSFNNRPRGNV